MPPVFLGTVTTETQLDNDIRIIDGTTTTGNYTITFGTSITEGTVSVSQDGTTVAPDLSAINLHTGVTLTINGAGDSLIGTNGSDTFRGLFVYSGNVSINNLTIKNAVATGGAGGYAGNFAGGGGAGLGGGLFVGNTATVTLNQVYFSSDKAIGGAGGVSEGSGSGNSTFYSGGGGLGGSARGFTNYSSSGGGGVGRTATGGNTDTIDPAANPAGMGIIIGGASGGSGAAPSSANFSGGAQNGGGGGYGYAYVPMSGPNEGGAGGGGGVGGVDGRVAMSSNNSYSYGGNGGFGGGGGGGFNGGGNGGFGGGGGGSWVSPGVGGWGGGGAGGGGVGGFGGGDGGGTAAQVPGGAGGGGLGAGGAVFVYKGGSLIIQSGTIAGGTVAAGATGGSYNSAPAGTGGSAFGSGIFIYGANKTLTLSPAFGKTVSIADVIADQQGSGDGSNSGGVLVNGVGTAVLSGINTFTGGATIQNGGTLELNAHLAAGSGAINFSSGFGNLQIQASAFTNGTTFSNTVNHFVAGNVIDLTGLTFVSGASATVSGGLLKVISNGITNAVGLTSSDNSFSVVRDSGTGSAVIDTNYTVTSAADLTADLLAINTGGANAFAGIAYTFDFTTNFAIASTQTINLGTGSSVTFEGGHATTGGGYEVAAGALIAGADGAIGSGDIAVDAGATFGLEGFSQTVGDLSGAGDLGLGTLTVGTANSTTFSGSISDAGKLIKQGSGTLTLSGSNAFRGGLLLNAGAVALTAAMAAGTGTITFGAGTGDILAFSSAAVPANVIAGLVPGQTLDVMGESVTSASIVNSNTLRIALNTGGPLDLTLNSGASYTGDTFTTGTDSAGGTDIIVGSVPTLVYGQTIDVANVVAVSETVTAGVLTLFNSGTTAVGTINVGVSLGTSAFTLKSDGAGGTDVIENTIFGTYASGVTLTVPTTTIASTAQVHASLKTSGAVNGSSGTAWVVVNQGSIANGGVSSRGISLAAGGTITNTSLGMISASSAVWITGGAGSLVNQGTLIGTASAVYLVTGSVTNAAGGMITGASSGVLIHTAAASAINLGQITATQVGGVGVSLVNGGNVTNGQSGTGTSSALIQGVFGVRFSSQNAVNETGTLTNFGTVISTNSASRRRFSCWPVARFTTAKAAPLWR